MTPEYYRRIARTLEDGKFHLAFFDDRLAMPDRFGDDFTESVRHGVRVVKMDPIPVLSVMGAETTRLGLGATHVPGTYEDFVHLVVPELQRRGIYHRDYAGTTLRENLGLAG